jgi:Flp pilus assembly CpaF family ATPase
MIWSADVASTLRSRVAESLAERRRAVADEGGSPLSGQDEQALAETLVWAELNELARQRSSRGLASLSVHDEEQLAARILADLFGLGGIEDLLADDSIEDIFVNGADDVIVARVDGRRERVAPVAGSDDELIELVNTWAARLGRTERRFDQANPRLDLRLPGGQRLHAIMAVTPRPTLTIRCPRLVRVTLADLVEMGTLSADLARFLSRVVRARGNVIVAGGTAAGKTTLLRALLHQVDTDERLITVEDTAELNLRAFPDLHPNVVEFETRDANVEGRGEITMLDLTRECLRMSPDRVVVGEVRGAEALAMLKAMSQGNDGSMCTIHAESARGVLGRIRAYCAESSHGLPLDVVDQFFRNAVDVVVHLARRPDRSRVVTQVLEVQKDHDDGVHFNELFTRTAPGVLVAATAPSAALRDRIDATLPAPRSEAIA